MSIVNIALILTIVKISHCETFNDSTSDQNQETPPCPFHFRSGKFGDPSSLFQFVANGILLPIVALFGLVSNVISIFIFTRREMRTPINLILTGKKHSETRDCTKKISQLLQNLLFIEFSFQKCPKRVRYIR